MVQGEENLNSTLPADNVECLEKFRQALTSFSIPDQVRFSGETVTAFYFGALSFPKDFFFLQNPFSVNNRKLSI